LCVWSVVRAAVARVFLVLCNCGRVCFLGIVFVFFFQAEDGIRDATVTGVQTCALPILWPRSYAPNVATVPGETLLGAFLKIDTRSEERRVGKECRYRWLQYN